MKTTGHNPRYDFKFTKRSLCHIFGENRTATRLGQVSFAVELEELLDKNEDDYGNKVRNPVFAVETTANMSARDTTYASIIVLEKFIAWR